MTNEEERMMEYTAVVSIRKINRLFLESPMKGGLGKVYGGVYGGERNRGMVRNWWEFAQYWSEWLTSSLVLRTEDESA